MSTTEADGRVIIFSGVCSNIKCWTNWNVDLVMAAPMKNGSPRVLEDMNVVATVLPV